MEIVYGILKYLVVFAGIANLGVVSGVIIWVVDSRLRQAELRNHSYGHQH